MKPDELERRLRNGSWPEPRPEVKTSLMRRARRRVAGRRRGLIFRWALAAAAALLIAINVVSEGVHARRMEVITGGPAIQQAAPPTAYAEGMRYRAQLLAEVIGDLGNS